MVLIFEEPEQQPMEMKADSECPVCLGKMQLEDWDGRAWQVCPNGCPTEFEVILRKPPGSESKAGVPVSQSRAAKSSST